MSEQPTIYRRTLVPPTGLPPDGTIHDDGDWLVPVEPTDRICDYHTIITRMEDTYCGAGTAYDERYACVMVDVVRMEEG